MSDDAGFRQHLLEVFRIEARQHGEAMAAAVVQLEAGGEPGRVVELTETAFRAAHTLKGAARAVNNSGLAGLCHALEGIFLLLKRGRAPLDRGMCGVLHEAVGRIDGMVERGGDDEDAVLRRLKDLRRTLEDPNEEAGGGVRNTDR
jgi:two-component system chemotaxis sensor kinase CheA